MNKTVLQRAIGSTNSPPKDASLENVDDELRSRIGKISAENASHWDFKGSGRAEFEQSPYQYPAMMVPALQREIVKMVLELQPTVSVIADPFVGSGTVLCEAMLAGRGFIGQDVNPLAILLSTMRSNSLNGEQLKDTSACVIATAQNDRLSEYAVNFRGQEKWFNHGVNIGLSRLRRAIMDVKDRNVRLFLWIVLSETIRLTSNSRTSTYKLHIRPIEKRTAQCSDVFDVFTRLCSRNLEIVIDFRKKLDEKGLVREGKFSRPILLSLADSRNGFANSATVDMIMSSPPYGDNQTTVPYGQAAWLPLQWIDGNDIASDAEIRKLLTTTAAIDRLSVGGKANKAEAAKHADELCVQSQHFKNTFDLLRAKQDDGILRLTTFIYDLKNVLDSISKSCAKNSYTILTLGHRRIRKVECPLTDIVSELSISNGLIEVERIQRVIPSKRMAGRNNISQTMKQETILILRKTEGPHA
jgi:putative methyltransferase